MRSHPELNITRYHERGPRARAASYIKNAGRSRRAAIHDTAIYRARVARGEGEAIFTTFLLTERAHSITNAREWLKLARVARESI